MQALIEDSYEKGEKGEKKHKMVNLPQHTQNARIKLDLCTKLKHN